MAKKSQRRAKREQNCGAPADAADAAPGGAPDGAGIADGGGAEPAPAGEAAAGGPGRSARAGRPGRPKADARLREQVELINRALAN